MRTIEKTFGMWELRRLDSNINVIGKQGFGFPYIFKSFGCQNPVVSCVRCVGIFRKGVGQIYVLLIVADDNGVVCISRSPDKNDDRMTFRQSLF